MKFAAWNPFRLKNLVIVALVLGIAAGIWLGDLFKGFGLGPGEGPGQGPGAGGETSPGRSTTKLIGTSPDDKADLVGHHANDAAREVTGPADHDSPRPRGLIKVVIDEREYYIRRGNKLELMELSDLVQLIKRNPPDADGMKARIELTANSRVTAEEKLIDALKAAGVPRDALYTPTEPVD